MPAVPNTVITAKAAAKPALNKKSATLTAGQTFQLKMKNNKKAVKWTSRNKKVASVSSNGVLTAKKLVLQSLQRLLQMDQKRKHPEKSPL